MAKTSCILHIFPDKLNWRLVIRAQGDATHPGATPARAGDVLRCLICAQNIAPAELSGTFMNRLFLGLAMGLPGALLAVLAAAASFWISGLPHHQASMLAAVIFPVVLLIYIFAVWRWRQGKNPPA